MRALLAAGAALALASAAVAAGLATPSSYLLGRVGADGGVAEPGGAPSPQLTAWAVVGLRAAGVPPGRLAASRAYLERNEGAARQPIDAALQLVARAALGERPPALLARVRPVGPGARVNEAAWAVLALRAAGERAPPRLVRALLRAQQRSGGWSWTRRGQPDSNDTAAVMQALAAAGVRGRPLDRGVAFLRRLQRPDGGFELVRGRGSDTQSTAWAVQALVAARRPPGRRALAYLARMRRPDGSYRYSARYITTPAWVTAQALAAAHRRPLPLPPP